MSFFFSKICKYLPFTAKNNRQKKFQNWIYFWILFKLPKLANLFFTWSKGSPIFLYCFHFSLQTKEQILFQAQPLKILNAKFLYAHFRVKVKICWGPAPRLISNISKKTYGFGVLKQFRWACRVPNFFYLKNHSTLIGRFIVVDISYKNAAFTWLGTFHRSWRLDSTPVLF